LEWLPAVTNSSGPNPVVFKYSSGAPHGEQGRLRYKWRTQTVGSCPAARCLKYFVLRVRVRFGKLGSECGGTRQVDETVILEASKGA
jgi:hypothetical protein